MHLYVVEALIPQPVYMSIRHRHEVGEAQYCGFIRGYWDIHTQPDSLGTPGPLGVRLMMELEADQITAAEDKGIASAARFGQILATHSGSPLAVPRLHRVARIGPSEGLFEQYNYYYLEGPDALPRVSLRPDQLDRLLSWFANLDEHVQSRAELASRWYGMSIAAQDPLDGYLSVWIGLESVGAVLSDRVHSAGVRAKCEVCQNPPGDNRNNRDAGIQHAIMRIAHELLASRSLTDLKEVRDRIAHALDEPSALRTVAEELLPDLQLTLIAAILGVARPEGVPTGGGRAILPREFSVYPESRSAIRSQVELVQHKPFYGQWLDVERGFSDKHSRIEPDGNYIWGGAPHIRYHGWVPDGAEPLDREYVVFARKGRMWEDRQPDSRPPVREIPWRPSEMTPAWERSMRDPQSNP